MRYEEEFFKSNTSTVYLSLAKAFFFCVGTAEFEN
ncbi:hypothetical protein Mucpa_1130 [Mucilaginibacter paludis DSM 18603]|uniref:Uncharacterized protein n=1 Tax=Mucilaginibacter paludis DSM 18603 TaxID=714943 RepID=H1YF45_9SPHI|nr:hypothetical protein Mucpa_1130 [Mucilaginibacter paludis DSM 18603]